MKKQNDYQIALEHIENIEQERHDHFMLVLAYVIEHGKMPPEDKPITGTGRVVTRRLNVRTGPGLAFPIIKQLDYDQEVEFTRQVQDGNNLWVMVGPGEWVAQRYQGREYIEPIWSKP